MHSLNKLTQYVFQLNTSGKNDFNIRFKDTAEGMTIILYNGDKPTRFEAIAAFMNLEVFTEKACAAILTQIFAEGMKEVENA